MNLTFQIIVLIVLLLLSAFFSSSETALTTISVIKVRNMRDKKIKKAETVAALIENKDKLLTTILIGNNLVNIGASALATSVAIELCGNSGVGVATGIMTFLVLIIGEITPKTLATAKAEKVSLAVAGPIRLLTILFSPFVFLLSKITAGFLRLFGVNSKEKSPVVTEEDLKTIIDMGHEEGVLDKNEKEMLSNVFDFDDVKAEDIMVPRADMAAISADASYNEFIEMFREEKFSKMPVYGDDFDDIKGIIHLKDLLLYNGRHEEFNVAKIMREAMFTFESKPVSQLFAEMRSKGQSCAIVLDEYGGTVGFLTMHDLIEEVFGEIDDEHDDEEFDYRILNPHELIADGALHLDDLDELIGSEFSAESDSLTIAGYLMELFGHIPAAGEIVEHSGISFKITEASKTRIKKIHINLGEKRCAQE